MNGVCLVSNDYYVNRLNEIVENKTQFLLIEKEKTPIMLAVESEINFEIVMCNTTAFKNVFVGYLIHHELKQLLLV